MPDTGGQHKTATCMHTVLLMCIIYCLHCQCLFIGNSLATTVLSGLNVVLLISIFA